MSLDFMSRFILFLICPVRFQRGFCEEQLFVLKTVWQRLVSDVGCAFRDRDVRATHERKIPDVGDAVGDRDAGQVCA